MLQLLRQRGISDDCVLKAMSRVRREQLVPEELRHRAYDDGPLPIGEGQTISQPYIVALMTEILIKGSDEKKGKVLEVGTGSGYQTAVLAEVFEWVYSVEKIKRLSAVARGILGKMGYKNVRFRVGDGKKGWPGWDKLTKGRGFNFIMVTAGAREIPEDLKKQLRDGGVMVIPVGRAGGQRLLRVIRREEEWEIDDCGAVAFVPLV